MIRISKCIFETSTFKLPKMENCIRRCHIQRVLYHRQSNLTIHDRLKAWK